MAEQPPQWELHSAQEPVEVLAPRVLAVKEELLVRWQESTKEEAILLHGRTRNYYRFTIPIFPFIENKEFSLRGS